jgi:hypothetical protein
LIEEDGKVEQKDIGQYGWMFGDGAFAGGGWRCLPRGLFKAPRMAEVASPKAIFALPYQAKSEARSYVGLTFAQKSIE